MFCIHTYKGIGRTICFTERSSGIPSPTKFSLIKSTIDRPEVEGRCVLYLSNNKDTVSIPNISFKTSSFDSVPKYK